MRVDSWIRFKLLRKLPAEGLCQTCWNPSLVRGLWVVVDGEKEGQTQETTWCDDCHPFP